MESQIKHEVPEVHIFKNKARKNLYFWYKNPITGIQENRSARTNNRKDARRFAEMYVQEMFGSDTAIKGRSILISDLADRYHEYQVRHERKAKTIKTVKDSFRQFIKSAGNLPLSEATHQVCDKFIYDDTPSKHTGLKHYTGLSTAFKFAVKHGLVSANPFEMVERPRIKECEKEVDWFNEEDFDTLWNSLPGDSYYDRRMRNMAALAFYTGLRLGEIRHLQIRHISVDGNKPNLAVKNILTPSLPKEQIFTTKNGSDRLVPLCQKAIDIIKSQIADNYNHRLGAIRESIYLFPSEKGTPLSESGATNKYREHINRIFPARALRFHSLRHGYGTRLVLKGIPPYVVQTNMGHRNISTTEKYWHFAGIDFTAAMAGTDRITSKDTPGAFNVHQLPIIKCLNDSKSNLDPRIEAQLISLVKKAA